MKRKGLLYVTEALVCVFLAFGFVALCAPIIMRFGSDATNIERDLKQHSCAISTILLETTYDPETRTYNNMNLLTGYILDCLGYSRGRGRLDEIKNVLDNYAEVNRVAFDVLLHCTPAKSLGSADFAISLYTSQMDGRIKVKHFTPLIVVQPLKQTQFGDGVLSAGENYFFYLEVVVYA